MFRWPLCAILAGLCLAHLYWALGGQWGRDKISPVVDGKPLVEIRLIPMLAAAFMFFLLAAVPVVSMKPALRKWLLMGMAIVFAGRAVGDFKYVGFFKSIRGTTYALWDTRVYAPLNLVVAALAGLSLR